MSGYLQRLMQTAARPAATVHPFAGSIFAAGRADESSCFASEESVVADSKTTASIPNFIPKDAVEIDSPRSAFRATELARPAAAAPEAEFEITQPPVRVPPERAFRPLVPNRVVVTEARLERPPSHGTSHDSHALHGPVVHRESDDIEIHIGRIEVTAVQPPAPRVPKAPDKGISLDAYLERRNGRLR